MADPSSSASTPEGQGRRLGQSEARPTCPACGAEVCNIRVKGEWVLGDWPPVVPVVDFDRMVVAVSSDYYKMVDGEVKLDVTSYDAFQIGAPSASILVQRHDCEALTRYRGYMTAHGQRKFEEFKREEATDA